MSRKCFVGLKGQLGDNWQCWPIKNKKKKRGTIRFGSDRLRFPLPSSIFETNETGALLQLASWLPGRGRGSWRLPESQSHRGGGRRTGGAATIFQFVLPLPKTGKAAGETWWAETTKRNLWDHLPSRCERCPYAGGKSWGIEVPLALQALPQ